MPKAKHSEYGEIKKDAHFSLTPTSIEGLDKMARQRRISRSEMVERIGRGLIPVAAPEEDRLGESCAN
ncbi:MAG: ribbon-helix-helix protein, CopG family [Coleofasciculus sp. S288]|nr:ribbon-helix-helix protein, CopG family [Coleofasciculus sp. S288]